MSLSGLARKKWLAPLLVILIIVLAIETTILVIIISQSVFGGRQILPGISIFRLVGPGCQTLVSSVESTTSSNRSILFTCPNTSGNANRALIIFGSPIENFFSSSGKDLFSPVVAANPTFSLPRGYLALSLTSQSCSSHDLGLIPLKSGKEIGIGGNTPSYNYCGVIDNSVSKVDSFAIDWSNATLPISRPAPFTMSVSPTTETVPTGGTANYTITLASLNGWTGNVTVGLVGGYTLGLPDSVNPPILVLKAGGSNVTTLTTPTCNADRTYCAHLGSNTIRVGTGTNCLVTAPAPGGWCVDQYNDVEVNVVVNVV